MVLSDKGKDHCDLLHQTRVSCEDVFDGNLIPVLIFGTANSERREYGYYQNPDCRIGKMAADAHSEKEHSNKLVISDEWERLIHVPSTKSKSRR